MQQILRAGPLKMTYQDGEIRGLVLEAEQTEIVRRIYSAVRDRNWGTVPARITCEEIEDGGDHFRVSFEANHSQDDIEFEWHGEIRGTAEGTLLFEFDGEARTTFERSRIGFCVLHPIRECVGAAVRIEHEDCSVEETCFPREIAPHEPFQAFKALSHQVAGNLWTRIAFEGEVFETEDQRNWIDASFKTFGTSLSLPYPVKIEAGMRVRQTVTVELIGQSTRHQTVQNSMPAVTVQITAGERTEKKLPPIGLGAASTVLSPTEVAALQTLSLNHLRIELNLKSDFEDALRMVAAEAQMLDCALEIAVFVGKESAAQTPRTTARLLLLAELLDKLQTPVHAFLIFADNV